MLFRAIGYQLKGDKDMIYFDKDKNAYAYEIENPICSITDIKWENYANTDKWDIINGVFTDISQTEEYLKKQKQKELERIAKLSMTRYDFFKYVCQPSGISYQQLIAIVNSNDEMAAAWNLCSAVYRGDETLCNNIKKYLPAMTDDALNEIFKQYGTENE